MKHTIQHGMGLNTLFNMGWDTGWNTVFHGEGMERDGTTYEMFCTVINTVWDGTHNSTWDGTEHTIQHGMGQRMEHGVPWRGHGTGRNSI